MKTLYLLRHAHTISAAPPMMGDHERALSPQGAADALAIGAFMQENAFQPDFVLSSSAVRTVQTAQLVLEKIGADTQSHFNRKLYQASADKILAEIRAIDDSIHRLLVVGHNPGVAELARALGDVKNYDPGTLTVFKADCQVWADFAPELITLERVFVPQP